MELTQAQRDDIDKTVSSWGVDYGFDTEADLRDLLEL